MEKNNSFQDGVLSTILPYITNKRVLDIGCVEHNLGNKNKNRIWVHDFLRAHALHVTGIDILHEDIETLKKQGYDVSCQSAESFHFNHKFDIIFAGELIEHLSNPGLFLQKCFDHLQAGGTLILTTPNCFSIRRFLGIIKRRTNDPSVNGEHTCWFSPTVVGELLRRHNFKKNQFVFVDYPLINPDFKHRIIRWISSLFKKFSETMIVICEK